MTISEAGLLQASAHEKCTTRDWAICHSEAGTVQSNALHGRLTSFNCATLRSSPERNESTNTRTTKRRDAHHLLSGHAHSLDCELAAAHVEEVLKVRAE